MDDPQCFEAEPVGLREIFFDNAFDVSRLHCVEIEDIGDGNADGKFKIAHKKR